MFTIQKFNILLRTFIRKTSKCLFNEQWLSYVDHSVGPLDHVDLILPRPILSGRFLLLHFRLLQRFTSAFKHFRRKFTTSSSEVSGREQINWHLALSQGRINHKADLAKFQGQWFSTGVPPIYELDVYLLLNCSWGCLQIVLQGSKGAANQKMLRNTGLGPTRKWVIGHL